MVTISVIVPTRALPERAAHLRRALDSVFAQEHVRVAPIVIINGSAASPELVADLRRDARLRTATLERADLPAALRLGRSLVDSPWFAELDDDDLLMPDALALRWRALEEHAACDVVVTSGIRRGPQGDVRHAPIDLVHRDPLRALCRSNWLLPGSWLCRTDAVDASLFERMPPYLECTWLAIHFATKYRMRYLEQATVIWHTDSPCAVSRSREYVLGQAGALERILELELPPDVRRHFRSTAAQACHVIAAMHVREGSRRAALTWHLRSLRGPGGWRYLPFTRRFFIDSNHGSRAG